MFGCPWDWNAVLLKFFCVVSLQNSAKVINIVEFLKPSSSQREKSFP
jgi:hypothetical protein